MPKINEDNMSREVSKTEITNFINCDMWKIISRAIKCSNAKHCIPTPYHNIAIDFLGRCNIRNRSANTLVEYIINTYQLRGCHLSDIVSLLAQPYMLHLWEKFTNFALNHIKVLNYSTKLTKLDKKQLFDFLVLCDRANKGRYSLLYHPNRLFESCNNMWRDMYRYDRSKRVDSFVQLIPELWHAFLINKNFIR